MNPHTPNPNTGNLHPDRPRHIRVQSWQDITPHLRRIVFHSESLADYPFTCDGAHIKLLFPKPEHRGLPPLPEYGPHGISWPPNTTKPHARAYTLRHFDRTQRTLTVDFVLHGDNGPASAFAHAVSRGQTLGLSVPGGPSPMLKTAPHYRMAGDLTALPAIEAMLADMPADAQGDVFLWLPQPEDLPPLPKAPGIRIHCFYGTLGDAAVGTQLLQAFCARILPPQTFVWAAGEAAMVKALRHQVRQVWQWPLALCYAVPYWKSGEDEDRYHAQRHDFMDADPTGRLD